MLRSLFPLLALALIAYPAASFASGLIAVPNDAIAKPDPKKPAAGSPGLALGAGNDHVKTDLPGHLANASQAEYENFFNDWIDQGKRRVMAEKAASMFIQNNVRCFRYVDDNGLYGFQRIPKKENMFDLNCFAGTNSKVTHVAYFQMEVHFPNNCGDEGAVRNYFKEPANRTLQGAENFYQLMRKACLPYISAANTNTANPISKLVPVSPDWVNNMLSKKNKDKGDVIETRVPAKKAPSTAGGNDDGKPKKKPGKKDSDCVPGNVLCGVGSAD